MPKAMQTILVIEDDAAVLDNVQDLLMAEEYVVIPARDGREGLKEARLRKPDLVICDIMMPDVDGYEVLRELRSRSDTQHIPFIFVTARAGRSDQRTGMDLGADDYLVKPFSSRELLSAVQSRLERHEAQNVWYQERIEEMRSNLSRTLPHELRTPLVSILGYSQFLMDAADSLTPEELRGMLREINDAGQRLERLVEKYYLYAQLEISAADPAWRANLQRLGISRPEQVVPHAARTQADGHERAGDLHLDVRPGVARVQDVYLEKIVSELVDNAFKFSEPGTAVRVVGLREADYYVLEVADQGRGMEAEQVQRIGAFVQFDRDRYEQQGLGLGLTVARRLTELHQGALTVESTPGEGTTVWVWLPLGEA